MNLFGFWNTISLYQSHHLNRMHQLDHNSSSLPKWITHYQIHLVCFSSLYKCSPLSRLPNSIEYVRLSLLSSILPKITNWSICLFIHWVSHNTIYSTRSCNQYFLRFWIYLLNDYLSWVYSSLNCYSTFIIS